MTTSYAVLAGVLLTGGLLVFAVVVLPGPLRGSPRRWSGSTRRAPRLPPRISN